MKGIFKVLLVVVLVLTLGACKSETDESDGMVLILPGPINDQSWNATNYAGLVAANEQLNTDIEYVENVKDADFVSTFRSYAERGYKLIMGAGSQFDTAANTVAKDYPDTTFVMVNGSIAEYDNVAPIFPKEYEASYLAGIIAGELTTNGKIGTISGSINAPMNDLLDVYEKVAEEGAAARGIDSPESFRANADSWSDVNKGKQMTQTTISTNNVDVMFVYANQVGLGAITACEEADPQVKFVGFSSNQNDISEVVQASVEFDFETFYVWAVGKFLDGTLEGKKVHAAGIKEEIFIPVYEEGFSQEIQDKVTEGINKVKNDEIDLTEYFYTN
ncbi:BMP family protein [Mycoplasmatota bacterium zrk1]